MYKPYRAALKALRREFDRAATRYPGLFYELLELPFFAPVCVISHTQWQEGIDLLERFYVKYHSEYDTTEYDELQAMDDLVAHGQLESYEVAALIEQLRRQRGDEPFVVADSSSEVWEAFVAANGDAVDGGWQEWDVFPFPNDDYCGRFFGVSEGLEDFRRLGESLSLVLNEIEPSQERELSYRQALLDMCGMAESHPDPLLRLRERRWGGDKSKPVDEGLYAKWKTNQQGEGYPLHPLCKGLAHNVFLSAIAAIDAILEPDSTLLISEGRQVWQSPFFGALQEDRESVASSDATTDSTLLNPEARQEGQSQLHGTLMKEDESLAELQAIEPDFNRTPDVEELYVFQRKGSYWNLRFAAENGDGVEHSVGLLRYQTLLKEPGRKFSSLELTGSNRDIPTSISHPDAVEAGAISSKDDGGNRRAKGDTCDQVVDWEAIEDIEREINKLTQAIEEATKQGMSAEIKQLERELRELKDYHKNLTFMGRVKRLAPASPEEKARKAVDASLRRTREDLQDSMPLLETHLLRNVTSSNGYWVYLPVPPIIWSF
jgi:hypothetical protein